MTKLMVLPAVLSLGLLAGCDQSARQATTQVSVGKPPASRIPELEDSAFCRKYGCRLDNAAPVVDLGTVRRWFYKYRLEGNDLMDIELWLSPNGERQEPYMIVNWRPIKPIEKDIPTAAGTFHEVTRVVPEKEIAPVRDLVNELMGSQEFDASTYVKNNLLSFWDGKFKVEPVRTKKFLFSCSYVQSNDLKFSLNVFDARRP